MHYSWFVEKMLKADGLNINHFEMDAIKTNIRDKRKVQLE